MENKKEKGDELYCVRSYLGCLDQGFKLPTRHILPLMGFLWPALLACALAAALFGLAFNSFSVVFSQWWSSDEPVMLSMSAPLLAALGVLWVLANSFYTGCLATVVNRISQGGPWDTALKFGTLRREITAGTLHALTATVVGGVVAGLLLAPCFFWLGAGSWWTWVVCAAAWLLLGVPYMLVAMDYLLGPRDNFWQSLKQMKDGYAYWGALFIVLFCGGLLVCVLSAVGWLPSSVLAYANFESMLAVAGGDATDLPACVPAFVVVAFALSAAVASVLGWLVFFPLAYLYGSIETRKKEKLAFEEEERRLGQA